MAGAELIGQEEIKEVMDVLETGVLARYAFFAERKGIWKVRQFEEEFARYCGAAYALGVTSGSAALKVALTALDVGPGDEVIVPAFTFLATYEAVLEVGAIPVMADIDATLNLDPDEIARKQTSRTKAVIPVHMCGSAAHIDRIVKNAHGAGLLVLEDNAQGCGASFHGRKLGSLGDMGIFSFDHYKTITTGEGGMVLTNDRALAERAEWYHDHGHDHASPTDRALDGRSMLGFNYRMNELQGALGLAQLRKLDGLIAAQRRNKAALKEALAQVKGVGFRELPDPAGDSATTLAFNFPAEDQAERFRAALAERGVGAVCFKKNFWHYVPNWEHFLARKAPNERCNPYTDSRNRGDISYTRESIPRAEDLLGRTLVMGIAVKMPPERIDAIRAAIAHAAAAL
jgi:8-amino-3,8-dideoxy-alpha-D-manno-octulosonate transaminase